MRVSGDLGFSSLVLVALWLVVPVIGFIIRRKWQHAVARQEEIKRLLILASEEAERVEQEATYEYGTVSLSVVKTNQCAVCYCPTTRRCARCKAVRYCSGECQIVHWRQGHREECYAPSTNHWNDDTVSDFGQKAAEINHHGIPDENSEIEVAQSKISFKASSVTDISHPEVSCGKDDNIGVEPLVEGNIADSNSESSSNSFSGFSASAASESSDDVSVCESIISNEFESSEGHVFVDPARDMLDTTSIDNNMCVNDSLSPKFASLLNSVDGFSTMHKLYETRPTISKEQSKLALNGTSGLSMCKAATVEPRSVSSDFWDETLDSRGIKGESSNDTLQSHSNEYSSDKKSVPGSTGQFSYSTLPSQHTKYPKEKYSLSDGAIPNSGGNNKSSAGSTLSENGTMGSSKARNSSSINSKGFNIMNDGTAGGSGRLESREDNLECFSSSYTHPYSSVGEDLKFTGSSSMSDSQSAGSKALNHVVDSPEVTTQLKSRALADAQSASTTEGHSHYSTKPGTNGVQSSIATLSQDDVCSANSKNGLKSSVLKVVDQFRGSNVSKCFPLAAGRDITGRYGDKGLFPYDLFVKLYTWNKVELQPFGLINCGNSCYANAVLQCLAFTPPLNAYFLQGLHSKACAKKKCCFMCEFESLILKSKEGKSPLSPKAILSQLQNIGSQLGNGREEDAHEFLRHVIDKMRSVCLSEAGVNVLGSEEETTLVDITFGGYIRSKITCLKCGGKSGRQEKMMDLTVEIEGEIATLEGALRRYTSNETLDGENKYQCVRCKSYEKAKKKLTVSEAPNILTIALKRFQSGKFGKLNKPIRFPEILDLAPFMSGTSDKSPIYRLCGVVVHLDILNAAFSGHYVCYVKNTQNRWFKVDDSMVTAVDLDEVLAKEAYMLLYARCSPRAPRLIRNNMVSSDTKSKALNRKTTAMKPKSASTNLSAADYSPSSISPDGSPSLDSFYSRFHHLKRILEEDSSSDNSSLISNNSDEGSWSTNSTHDSTTMDEFSDSIFGDSIRRYGNSWRNSDSETSSTSSSSPVSSGHSPLSDMGRYASVSPDATVLRTHTHANKEVDGPLYRLSNGVSRPSDANTQHRKLDSSRSSSSNFGDTDSFRRLGSNHFNDINSGISCRKSRERTD